MATPNPAAPPLSAAQQQALATVRQRGVQRLLTVPYAAIHIHFHPDWLHAGASVIEHLASSGRYLSQFESGRSNGSYSPQTGGQRWQWEHDGFGGAYDAADVSERPVYGAVDLHAFGHAQPVGYGAAPRFGSAWLQLHAGIAARSSFCDPDSYWHPQHLGVWPQMDWQQLQCLALPDPLDHYVEAQVHGGLLLARDVAALVLDPSFADTPIAAAAQRCDVPLRWHGGYRFSNAMLAPAADYRGAEIADALQDLLQHFGSGLGASRSLSPADLGRAQAQSTGNQRYDAPTLKKAWHCLARFGGQPLGHP